MSPTIRGAQVAARTFQGVKELAASPLLDRPSEPNPKLDRLMEQAVTAMYLVANGATMDLNERIVNGNKQRNAPGDDTRCADLLAAFRRARTHRERLMLVLTAQEELRAAKLVDRSKVCDTEEWRAAIKADTRSLRTIAVDYGISHETVRKIRLSTP